MYTNHLVLSMAQVVTTSVVESKYVTVTQTVATPVVETVVSTQFQRQYVTTVQTQYVTTTTCVTIPSNGYSYPTPVGSGAPSAGSLNARPSQFGSDSARPGYGGYYGSSTGGGYQGPFYGPYYARPVSYVRQSRKKGLFGKWGF